MNKIPNHNEFKQSELNIGTLGHVDHGKTTLTAAITGVWTDKHSESIKRSMTIKLGYADALIRKCENCEGPAAYTVKERCEKCGGAALPFRRISILDAPGHETLMATAIAGSNIIDAVLFVIAANEECPMPQTREHLMIINALEKRNAIIVQTKIDIVGRAAAEKNYAQIKDFVKGSVIENAPIVPVVASKNINIDALLEQIAKMEVPKRDLESDPLMYIVRSFDVNRPGTPIDKIAGGVVGGSIMRGRFKVGDEIEIRPGINKAKEKSKKEVYEPIITRIVSLSTSTNRIDEAVPGGLIAIGTDLNPVLTKADSLVGNIVGHVGKLPEPKDSLELEYHDLNRVDLPKQAFRENEPVILGVGTGTVIGYVKSAKKRSLSIALKHQVCVAGNIKIAILRNLSQRWRLVGYGVESA
ncbi:MAG: translation initiation factor IF-2 subunit gamma [Candidatus Micrarchaeaceae archaeon]